ncbi:MAG: ferrous iron transport protein B [Promethearchaeota archaeon]
MAQTIAVIGNPNVGKTVVFNALTGLRAHVANWPGVTVEKKTGKLDDNLIVDLPGVYSLSPVAVDDLIARNFIVRDNPDLVVDILDGTNLERNLYLALLLAEFEVPLVFALNMMDVVRTRKMQVDVGKLGELLGVPIVPTAAIKKEGIDDLKRQIKTALARKPPIPSIKYSQELESRIEKVVGILAEQAGTFYPEHRRWAAIKLLENDKEVVKELRASYPGAVTKVDSVRVLDDEFAFASERYEKIAEIVKACYVKEEDALTTSDILDKVFLHKWFGIPIFMAMMWMLFEFTFHFGAPFMTMIEWVQGALSDPILESSWGGTWYASFLADGIIGGMFSVFIFLPNIFLMFLGLSFLEDSGYLSRAAFVMDRLMYKIGFHGRSFVSLILGFGCNIPAIMSARAIEDENDRLTTILVNQNISCGARLPVYIIIGGAVWGAAAGSIVYSLYALGILAAISMALLFRKTLFKGERAPFVLELGDYRMPTAKYTGIHMWERGREFLKKAGTIIFVVVVVMWCLQYLPWGVEPGDSALYKVGQFFSPVFIPLGFGIVATVGLVFGFLAKEVVVAAFAMMLGVAEDAGDLGALIFADLGGNPVIAFSYLVFVLLYVPCVASLGAIYRETGSWKWTAFSALYGVGLAYLGASLVQLIGGVWF